MSRGERQKPVTQEYRDNYDVTFRKGKQAKPTQPHRDKSKYDRTKEDDLSRKSGGW